MFKKLLAMMLAVMTVFSLSSVAFAHENVDNTFDHFTPEPGVTAPDNWYDPYCYESDGRINKYCLNQGGEADEYASAVAMYCPEYKKIFTVSNMGRKEFVNKPFIGEDGETYIRVNPPKTETFRPYEVECKDWAVYNYYKQDVIIVDKNQWFCPYCGKYETAYHTTQEEYEKQSARYTHQGISSVVYGFHCDECSSFVAGTGFSIGKEDLNPLQFKPNFCFAFGDCKDEVNINEVKLYRFLNEKQRNAVYSFIFKETEMDFGDGKDGRIEDLRTNSIGVFNDWDSPDNPYGVKYQNLSFFEKVAYFFASIADFFKRIFTGIFNF